MSGRPVMLLLDTTIVSVTPTVIAFVDGVDLILVVGKIVAVVCAIAAWSATATP